MNIKYLVINFLGNSDRSKEAVKNIALSLASKSVSILCSLLVVPLTIDYVNPTQYGIWLSIYSIIAWISFFDLGLGNGFRNKFAESKAKGDINLARQYVSTTYFILSLIASLVFFAILILNYFLEWDKILNVDIQYREELQGVFAIVSGFFCLNLIVNTFSMLLSADQKPGYSSMINGLGSLFSIVSIFILTKFTEGSLLNLAFYLSGIPSITLFIVSVIAFRCSKYRLFKPSISLVKMSLVSNIMTLGVKFFGIYLCMILIFQIINIVISRELGPLYVTKYNISYSYFNVIYSVWILILSPIWSSFTDAYTKNDIVWMKSIIHKYEKLWLLFVVLGCVMLLISPLFYKLWIGDKVQIPLFLSLQVLLFFLTQAIAGLYMQSINGIGKVRLQILVYCCFAIISWPMMVLSARFLGLYGILILPTLVYLVQAVVGRKQLFSLLSNSATGIFNK